MYKMEANKLSIQLSARKSLFDQGYIDEVQFIELENLEDDMSPNFVEEMVNSFYTDSLRLINTIDHLFVKLSRGRYPTDFGKLDDYVHQFTGSCSSIGAKKVISECWRFREYCRDRNLEGCIKTFNVMKIEHATLRRKLEAYFKLSRHN